MMLPNRSTPMPTAPPGNFSAHLFPRPLLARDADSMYWMSRYVERAEHVARLLLVHSALLIDVGDLAPVFPNRQWQSVLKIIHLSELSEDGAPAPTAVRQRRNAR